MLGCILCDVPKVMGVSGLSTSDPLTQVTQPVQTQLMALSIASVTLCMVCLFAAMVTPSIVRTLQMEHPAQPQQPTSLCLYTDLPAPSIWRTPFHAPPELYKGKKTSLMITCLVVLENMARSGWRAICVMWSGSFSCLPTSTNSCQSGARADAILAALMASWTSL